MKKKTYKVLFADDEYWTREKMRSMIPWETYDLDFLEPAADGEDAWEKINNYQPDIFITDINMPFLSGGGAVAEGERQISRNYYFCN